MIRLLDGNVPETVRYIQNKWEEFNSDYPFEYFWLDDEFGKLFDPEKRASLILAFFSILSILISCLGLLGLISFTASQRTREIGVRKAMGASVHTILYLLSRETVQLLVISTILTVPFYFGAKLWLQNFAYHIPFGFAVYMIYLLAVVVAVLLIALLTVSFVAYRAATANPAESLRVE